ncbi:hypothetical protein CB3_012 [Pectobacterium phage vB_PatP_CB3]|uniref:Uncharacterized protein n=2 Tax=Cbunavirus CB4 TaxID=2845777 RepID=A0A2P0N9S3_9CAUD|nr:hypothetical protein HWB09_gp012 [Pectobacterium phage vB_PatP_CB4]AQT27854.1 hypothetical protein CB4_012 [Pectobacterium phage vB_PatP_CB4]ARB11836.1 hypothetical protein CB3_012 [Pectobacterium phage vB_PatP_CB3]
MIFVFGSNLAGIHGAGAAKYALKNEGAIWGKGTGHHGNSYAIPTKDERIQTLPLWHIAEQITDFIAYAYAHPELEFQVTQIGCGLAGYKASEIAPLFREAPFNCYFDSAWSWYLSEHKQWGTQ